MTNVSGKVGLGVTAGAGRVDLGCVAAAGAAGADQGLEVTAGLGRAVLGPEVIAGAGCADPGVNAGTGWAAQGPGVPDWAGSADRGLGGAPGAGWTGWAGAAAAAGPGRSGPRGWLGAAPLLGSTPAWKKEHVSTWAGVPLDPPIQPGPETCCPRSSSSNPKGAEGRAHNRQSSFWTAGTDQWVLGGAGHLHVRGSHTLTAFPGYGPDPIYEGRCWHLDHPPWATWLCPRPTGGLADGTVSTAGGHPA